MSKRPNRKPLTPISRISRWFSTGRIVEAEDGCWLWTGCTNWGGYGQAAMSDKVIGGDGSKTHHVVVHRFVFEYRHGAIPEGLDLDHLCRVRNCVNPDHLEPVTRSENLRRAVGIGSQWSSRTECSAGHEYTPESTAISSTDGSRVCRACRREYSRRYAAKRAAVAS